jgi:large subunit GTPase 1
MLLFCAYLLSVRRIWADYFDQQGLRYAFYSASDATARQEALREASAIGELTTPLDKAAEENQRMAFSEEDDEADAEESTSNANTSSTHSAESHDSIESEIPDEFVDSEPEDDKGDPRAKVLSVLELEDLFIASAPDLAGEFPSMVGGIILHITHDCIEFNDSSGNHPGKLVVGLVGYPNVGKSSTINSLLGEKKVSVSSTPGKTKHFQTINLSDKIILCDCPGLVFPQFATTKADLVCDGVLPIDQLREHTGPVSLVVRRIPKAVLEGMYGLNIKLLGSEEGGDGSLRAEDLLVSYAGWSLLIRGLKEY